MGNEQTKDRDLNMNGKVLVNGVSANVTPNGMKIDANGKTIVQQNGGPKSFDLSTESTDYVVVESDSPHADAPVISETLEAVTQTEQVNESKGEKVNDSGKTFKKTAEPPVDVKIVQGKETSNEEQTSVSPPATDPQLELDSCGSNAAAVITTDLGVDEKSETSMQTDRRADANISTQTADEGQTPRVEGPMEEVAMLETAATEEDTLVESAAVIAEEVVEVTADVEPSDSQTAGIIIEEVVIINNDVYENIELRVEQTGVTDSFEINPHKNCDPEEEAANETEADIAEEPETNSNKLSVRGETVDEDHILDEALPLEISSSLPKEVADCTEVVVSAAPESSYVAAVNKMEPSVYEVVTEDNDEGASELSADAVLIELALSESNAVTPEVMESNGFPSFEEEPVHTIMETNSEVVCEEPNQTPANQAVPQEEPSIPLQGEHDEATADEAVAVEDVPEISEELHSAEAPSNKLMATEELLKDTSSFPEDESKSESILEIIASDESAEVSGDVMADVRPKTAQEEEPGPAVVKDDTEVTLEAVIDALSQDFELSPITSEVAAVEKDIPLIEELITATTFVPLSREQEANLPVSERVAEEMNSDSTEALSNEFDAVPDNVKEDTIVQEPPPGEVTRKESEKSVEEVSEDVLAQVKTSEQVPVFSEKSTEENPSICEEAATTEVLMEELLADTISEKPEVIEIIAEEPAAEQADVPRTEATAEYEPCISVQEFIEENAALTEQQDVSPFISEEPANTSPFQQQVLVGLLKTTDDKTKNKTTHEADNSCEVFAALDKNSEDSQTPTLDEPVAESVKAPLATAGDDIITEDAMAVCDILALEKTAPEIIPEGETKEKTKSELNVNATASDVEALPVGLHSTFTSVTELTMDKLHVTENIVEELADEHNDVPQSVTTAESAPCVLVQEELVEENVTLSISAAEETTDSSPVNSEEPVEGNVSLLGTQEELVVILKNTKDEVADKSTHESDTSDDVSASVDRSSEDSHISTSDEPVAECVEAAARFTLTVDIITEDVTAEFNLLTMENTAAEMILEGGTEKRAESESNVNSAEDIPEKLEVTEHIFEEPAEEQANLPPIEAPGESVLNISVQEELIDENYDNSVAAVEEPRDSSPVNFEEPVEENGSLLETQEDLVEILKTTEDKVTDKTTHESDTSDDAPASVDNSSEDSQISTSDEPVAECVEAVLDTIVDDIITENVMAECNLVSSEGSVPKTIHEGENGEKAESESNVNSIASLHSAEMIENTPVATTDMEALPVKPHLAITSVSEATSDKLEDTECVEAAARSTAAVDIITEDDTAEFNLLTTENTAPEIILEGETGERAEGESNENPAASKQSAILIEDTPVTSTDMEVLPVVLESACTTTDETTSDKSEDTENIFEEPAEEQADVPQIEAPKESVPCISVQEELVEENVDTSVVAVEEPTDSSPDFSEEPVEGNGSLLETQVLVENLETSINEATDVSAQKTDTCGNDVVAVDKNPIDSQISTSDEPVAECVEAVLDTNVNDITTEDVTAECNLMSSAEVVPETIPEGKNGEKAESESNVNSTASPHGTDYFEDSSVSATDLEAFPVGLHSTFTSVTEVTMDKLLVTENIIEDPADERAYVPQSVTTSESVPCISVQEELVEENVSPLEPQNDLVVILKTTENEVTDKSAHESDTSDDVSTLVDRSSEDSHISTSDKPVAECVETAACSTVAVDIITEDDTAEFNLLTTENTAPEIILEGETEERPEGESNVNPAASMQSAILIEETPVTSTDMGVLPVRLESACATTDEAILEKLEVTENIIEEPAEEPADVPQIEAPAEPVPCNSFQAEMVEETIDKSAVAVEELRDSCSLISEEPEEGNLSLLKAQVLFENLETTEDKVTEVSKHQTDTSDNVSAAVDKNSEDSQISTSDEPMAECVEAVLDTIAEDIHTEDAMAECNLVTMKRTAPETIHKGETEERAESESNVNSTASMHSAEMIEDTPFTSTDMEALPVTLQSAFITAAEVISEKFEDTKKVLEEPAEEHTDAPPMEVTGGSVPWVSVQEELAEENVAKSVVAIEKTTDSSLVNFEEPVEENIGPLELQEEVVILKTTEGEVTVKSTHESDTSDEALASVDNSSEDSQISTSDEPVAECFEAVLDTNVDDIITEDVMAECNLVSSEWVVPETIHEGENGEKAEIESNVNSTDSLHSAEMIEDSPVTSTDMEALPVGLHSTFTSASEVTSDKLEDTESIIEELSDEQAEVPQMEATRLSVQFFSVQEELIKENYDNSVAAVEETTDSSPANSEEPVEENVSLLEPQEDLVVILETTEDEVTDKATHESDTSDDVSASVDRSSEDSHITTSNEPVAECVEAVVDTVVDEIITEEVTAEFNILSLENTAPEIILEGETEERAEGESNENPAASMQSAILIEDTPVTSTDMEVLPVVLESACTMTDETTSDKVEHTENIIEEPAEEQADVPQIEAPKESVPCISVQEELVEENVDTSVVAVEEPTDSSPDFSEEPVEGNVSHLEAQVLVENLETTEDEATDVSAQKTDTSGNDVVAVDKNPIDSQISTSDEPVAECVEAVLDTNVNDITTEDVMAECNLVSSAEVVPETFLEGGEKAESESNVNSTASLHSADYLEDSSISATDMEAFPVRLHSTFTSVTEVTMDKLLVTINMTEDPADEHADVPQSMVTEEPVLCVQEELVEENVAKSVVAVDETTDSSPVNFEEPVEENFSLLETQEDLVEILKTTEDEVTDKATYESDTSDDVSASVDRSSEDSQISTSDEPVAECVEAVVDSTLEDDITTEDFIAECNLMTLEKVTLKIIAEEETEERAEGESNVNSTASTQSAKLNEDAPDATTDKEVFAVRLESACTTALEAIPEKLEDTENIVKESADEQADAPPMEVTGEFVPSVSVQEELDEDNVAKSVVVEPKDSSPVNFEEPVEENVSLLEPQELVVILKTTKDEVSDKATHKSDTSDYVLAAVDKNSEDSQISAFSEPVAEYVEAVLVDSTVADDIMKEEVMAECYIVTLEKTAPEIIPEEKTNLSDLQQQLISAASTQSAEMIEDTPFTSTDMEVLPVVLESACTTAAEDIPEKLEVTEDIFEEPAEKQANLPQIEAPGESVPNISVQEELVDENVTISVVALEETTDSSPVNFEELVERSESSLEPQQDLSILKTTQDKFTEKSTHETDDSEKNSEDSQISTSDEPVAECVKAVLETISEDITTEDITAECNMTLVKVIPEILTEGDTAEMAESESHATALTQTAEMIGNTSITSTDMEALLVSLQSACTSVVEKSAFRLHGFLMSSLEYGITVSIHVAPKKEQH